ncbi:MAG: STAS-like domain-containing protein, partial [Candidatus Omnitrophica bacterium]|nr:STAS-like domain-containing protein [Candidatus Omnitrophota bacterium]
MAKGPVVIDFEGTNLITQGFSDEFLGPILLDNGQDIFRRIKFKNCSDDVRTMILSTARRFLSGAQPISYS